MITYKYTTLVDKDKNLIGTSEDDASVEVVQKQELAIEPDDNLSLLTPAQIKYCDAQPILQRPG